MTEHDTECDDVPVACTPGDERERRREGVTETLVGAIETVEERPDGYEFVLEGTDEALTAASTFVRREAERCSFARFEIAVPQEFESVRPPFAGPDGTKDLFETGLVEAFGIAV